MAETPTPSPAPGYGASAYMPHEIDRRPRCWQCDGVIAWLVTRPWKLKCRRCKADNKSVGFDADMRRLGQG